MIDADVPPLADELRALVDGERAAPVANAAQRAAIRAKLGSSLGIATGGGAAAATATFSATAKIVALVVAVAAAGAGTTAYVLHRGHREASPVHAPAPAFAVRARMEPPIAAPTPSRSEPVVTSIPSPPVEPTHVARHAIAPSVPSESSLLAAAWRARSAGDTARALSLVDECARTYPTGPLAEEREALRIDTLLTAGRGGEARDRARAFLDHYPDSIHRALAEAALREKESP